MLICKHCEDYCIDEKLERLRYNLRQESKQTDRQHIDKKNKKESKREIWRGGERKRECVCVLANEYNRSLIVSSFVLLDQMPKLFAAKCIKSAPFKFFCI